MRIASGVLAVLLAVQSINAADSVEKLTAFLATADGTTDHVAVARALDSFRAIKPTPSAAESLGALLAHRSPLYRDRDKVQVVRLRSHILATLAEIGVPRSAEWALYDTLAHLDERISARELGAAARAVRTLGTIRGRPFLPFLIETLSLRLSQEEFSLERYDASFPPAEATTVQIEAIRALATVATLDDSDVLRLLRQLANDSGQDPRAAREAHQALQRLTRDQ